MKCLTMYSKVSGFLLFALVAAAMGGQMEEKFKAAKQKCTVETGIDPAILMSEESQKVHSLADDKCFYRCMFKEYAGKFTADGSMDVSKMISNMPNEMPERERMVSALTDCADKKGGEDCETAHKFVTCLHEKKMMAA